MPTTTSEYFETQFRPLPKVVFYDKDLVDPQNGLDTYWDGVLYHQDRLDYKGTHNKPDHQIESNEILTDLHVTDALWFALIAFGTVNPQLPDNTYLSSKL